MEAFFITAHQLAILTVLLIVGYYIRRRNLITDGTVGGLSYLLLNVCVPATIFISLQIEYSPQRLKNGVLMTVSYVLVMLLGYLIAHLFTRHFKITGDERKIWLGGALMFNALFIGLPITQALYGETAVFYLCFGVLGLNITSFSFGIYIFTKKDNRAGFLATAIKIIKTPAIVACVSGFIFFALQWEIPRFAYKAGEYMSNMTVPISMLVSGALMSKGKLSDLFKNKRIYAFSAVRLLVIPIITLIVILPFIDDVYARNTIVLGGAMPTATMTPVFAEQYSKCGDVAVRYWSVSTILSLFTLPLISFIVSLV